MVEVVVVVLLVLVDEYTFIVVRQLNTTLIVIVIVQSLVFSRFSAERHCRFAVVPESCRRKKALKKRVDTVFYIYMYVYMK